MHFQSVLLSKIAGVKHGFGSISEHVPSPLEALWKERRPFWKQVHGKACVEVTAPGQQLGETDAVWTRAPGLPIAVTTADCVPVLLARRDGSAVAAVHAGWRGTRARILAELCSRLGGAASEWVAAVGPSIGPCCYEVSEELASEFAREFGDFAGAVPRFRHLDLPAINAHELGKLGIAEVELLRHCTRCSIGEDGPLLHSYRREGKGTGQYSMIVAAGG